MPDKKKKIIPGKPQRPNYQVWIIITLIALIFGVTYFNKSESMVTITKSRFESMVRSNDVKKVVLIRNQNLVEISLKSEANQNAKYRKELENNSPFGVHSGPHYKLKIGSIENFENYYQKNTA